jgi:hypothetical protein
MRRAWRLLIVATTVVAGCTEGGTDGETEPAAREPTTLPGTTLSTTRSTTPSTTVPSAASGRDGTPRTGPGPEPEPTPGSAGATAASTIVPASTIPASTIPASTVPTSVVPTTVLTPATLAAALDAAERGIRDESLPEAALAEHGRAQQDAYRAAGTDRALLSSLPALVGDDVRDAVALNVAARVAVLDHAARRAASGATSEPVTTLPAWTIVPPRPIDELLAYYREAEELTDVPWQYLAAINFVETRMGRIVGASSAGAVGPMQFLPSTWAACCSGDVTDPRDAIVGAATYLRSNGAPGDMVRALHAYNPNEGYVGSVIAYAANIAADERAYVGYHAWEVYVSTSAGAVHLPVGYAAIEPLDAATYVSTATTG